MGTGYLVSDPCTRVVSTTHPLGLLPSSWMSFFTVNLFRTFDPQFLIIPQGTHLFPAVQRPLL